jgi:gamma-glutamyl phosphate reductase
MARQKSYELLTVSTTKKNAVLKTLATELIKNTLAILKANARDL